MPWKANLAVVAGWWCLWLVPELGQVGLAGLGPGAGKPGKNLFANPSFEMGRPFWHMDKAGATEGQFAVDGKDAADGSYSATVKVGRVERWGVQFGQFVDAGKRGGTYTFAVLARSLAGPVRVGLAVERHARPWDTAGAKYDFLLDTRWRELHVTFTARKDFPQGWFAYIARKQPNARFRVDMFRLYEGRYVP